MFGWSCSHDWTCSDCCPHPGLPPEATTEEDSPEEDDFELEISVPVDNLFFWIAVGVAALLLFILLICVLVGLCKNRRGKKTSKYVIQENPYATGKLVKLCKFSL